MSVQPTTEDMRILRIEDATKRRQAAAMHAAKIGVFEFDPATSEAFWDVRTREMFGVELDVPTDYALVIAAVHPDDRDMHDAETARVIDPESDGHMDMTYRMYPHDGSEMRYLRAVANCYFDGQVPMRLVGTVQDVTREMKQIEENRTLLYELEHRVKNTLSVATAVVDLSRIGQSEIEPYYQMVSERLRSLALSHDALRRNEWRDVDLLDLVRREAENFLGEDLKRMTIEGDTMRIPARHVMTLSMAVHELFTNAAKHGALSVNGGHVTLDVRSGADGTLLTWTEKGSAPADPSGLVRTGFGNVLLREILPAEMKAKVDRQSTPDGLIWTIHFDRFSTEEAST